jgi:1,4-alpha-glucan branching enzyme/maltooligosyltrehalose trehalohydrolase
VHAIRDNSPKRLLQELDERVRAVALDRHIHLVLENEENEAEHLARRENGKPCWYTAQWNDDVHHVLHVAARRRAITPTIKAIPRSWVALWRRGLRSRAS